MSEFKEGQGYSELPTPKCESATPRTEAPRRVPTAFEGWRLGPRYRLMQILGHGSYGEVAKAYDNVTKKHVAVKRMRNVFDQNTDAKRIFREIHLLRRLHHPHVIRLLDIICPNLDNPLTADAPVRPMRPGIALLGAAGPHGRVGASKNPLSSDCMSHPASLAAAVDSPTAMSASTDEGDDEQDKGGPSKRMRVEGSNGSVGGGSVGSLNDRERGLGHQLSSVSTGSAMSEEDGAFSADTTPAGSGSGSGNGNGNGNGNGCASGSNGLKESGGFAVPLGRTGSGDAPTSSGSGPGDGGFSRTPTETMSRRELSDVLSDLYMVFEFHDTDLYKLIVSAQFLTTPHVQTFVYQLLVGMKYVHSSNVVHRDLKPANILVNEDCSLKLCDFGLARVMPESSATGGGAAVTTAGGSGATTPLAGDAGSSSSSADKDSPGTPQPLRRQLTRHVVTRWYRAPELILLFDYTTAVDVWSLGCIFAELLGMQRENCARFEDRAPLFPGSTCYPLSGDGLGKGAQKQPYSLAGAQAGTSETEGMRMDQLSVIFDIIGTPTEADIADIAPMASAQLVHQLRTMNPKPRKDLKMVYPGADDNALSLLRAMLEFSPMRRISVDEALGHPFFADIRNDDVESKASLSATPLHIEAEMALETLDTVLLNVINEVRGTAL